MLIRDWSSDVCSSDLSAHRLALMAGDAADAATQLRGDELASTAARSRPARDSGVVFRFPGQGAVYPGMGRELYASEPVFRQSIDYCVDALADTSGFEAAAGPGLRECMFCDDAQALLPTAVMQPATFAIEHALARLWLEQYGIRPVALVGHSVGQFAAATLPGVFPLPDAVRLVAHRGRPMPAPRAGWLLAVRAGLDRKSPRLTTITN